MNTIRGWYKSLQFALCLWKAQRIVRSYRSLLPRGLVAFCAATSNRSIVTAFTGDANESKTHSAAANSTSPAMITVVNLSSGFNAITVPPSGVPPVAVTIVPPSGNTQTLQLKGVTGDTGVALHKTDPTSIGLDTGAAFGITAGGTVNGLRLFWY